MELPYSRIFKQAWTLTKTKKFLWALGLFLMWGNFFAYLFFGLLFKTDSELSPTTSPATMTLGVSERAAAWLGLLFLTILVILFWGYIRSRAAIVLSTRNLMDRQPAALLRSILIGKKYSARLMQLWVVLAVLVCSVVLILSGPVGYLYGQNLTQRASALGLMAALVFGVVAFILSLLNIFSGCFVVLHDMKVSPALRAAADLITTHWGRVIRFAGRMITLSVLTLALALVVQVIVLMPFVILSGLSYDTGGNVLNSPIILLGLSVAFGLFFWILAVLGAFQHICWTLVFMELVRPQKTETAETPEVVPEIVQ